MLWINLIILIIVLLIIKSQRKEDTETQHNEKKEHFNLLRKIQSYSFSIKLLIALGIIIVLVTIVGLSYVINPLIVTLTILIISCIIYFFARSLYIKGLLIVTVGVIDKILITISSVTLIVAAICSGIDFAQRLATIATVIGLFLLFISLTYTIYANREEPVMAAIALLAKLVIVSAFVILICVFLIAYLVTTVRKQDEKFIATIVEGNDSNLKLSQIILSD